MNAVLICRLAKSEFSIFKFFAPAISSHIPTNPNMHSIKATGLNALMIGFIIVALPFVAMPMLKSNMPEIVHMEKPIMANMTSLCGLRCLSQLYLCINVKYSASAYNICGVQTWQNAKS
jgi:hypothetical protein